MLHNLLGLSAIRRGRLLWLALAWTSLCVAPLGLHAQIYWDLNGKSKGAGTSPAGTWSTSSSDLNWSTDSTGKSSTSAWVDGSDAIFSAGTTATGAYTVAVSGTVSVSSINVEEGALTFSGGTIQFIDTTPGFTVASGLTATVNSVVAGNWTGLNKLGAGTLVFNGANTYTGGTTISAGTLIAGHASALGAASWSNTVASGATLGLQGGIALNQNALNLTGTGAGGSGALRNVSGDNSLSAQTTFGGDTTITSASGTLTHSGTVNLGSSAVTVNGAGNTAFTGALQSSSSSASLTYAGTGTMTLGGSAANTSEGTLTVASGTVVAAKTGGALATNGGAVNVGDGNGAAASAILRLDANQQLALYTSLLTINADGKLALNNVSQSVDKIAGTGLIDLATSGYLTVGAYSGNSVFAGTVTGTGTLEKAGWGTLTLESSFSFDGTLVLSGGTLLLDGITLGVGTLHVTGNTILDFGTSLTSALTTTQFIIDAGVTLTIKGWASGADAFIAQTWSGATLDTSGASPMNQIAFDGYSSSETLWSGYDRQVTPDASPIASPVPEPSHYAVFLLTALGAVYGWRRRRSH